MGLIQKIAGDVRPRSAVLGAVSAAAVLIAAFLVVQSAPRSELDVQLSDGAVWVASTTLGGVNLLDGGSGTTAASLGVAEPGDDFTVEQFGSDAVIVNTTDGTVARLDGASWELPTGRVQFGVPGQPLHVVAGDGGGWLMTPGQATTVDLEQMALRTPIPIAAPFFDGLVADDGSLLYASSDPELPVQRLAALGGEVTRLADIDGPTALIDLGQVAAGVDLDDRSVWIEGQGIVCPQLEFPEGATINAAGGDNRLLVVSDQGGAFVWNPLESGCPGAGNFINLGPGQYGEPALTDGWAVVPEVATGSVLIIDLEAGTVTDRAELEGIDGGAEVTLIAEDGSIWYNDPATANAGLIRRDGTIIPISKYEEGATGFTSAPVDDADDGADDVSFAGAQQEEEQALDETPEAEQVAGPEQTTTTVAAGNDPAPENQAGTTTTTVDPGTPDPEPEDTTTTTEGDTTDPDPDPGDGGDGTTTTTEEEPDPGDGGDGTTTTTEEQPEVEISMGVSAFSVTVGETINFTAIEQHGNPNDFGMIAISPSTGWTVLPLEAFGSFRVLFDEPGTYVATITACDPDENCGSASATVTIVDDPDAVELIAAIDGPTSAVVGETITLRDISQGEPESWDWSTQGGDPFEASTQNLDVSWDTPGTKTIQLVVADGPRRSVATHTVEVTDAPTPAPFGLLCSPGSVEVGSTIDCQLDGTASDFSDISFSSNADGAAGFTMTDLSASRVRLASTAARSVTVTLTATDDGTGELRSDTASVEFTEVICSTVIPTVNVSGPTTLQPGQTGAFSATSNAGCGTVSESWSATGGATIASPNNKNTNISWNTPGTYTVTFNSADGGGAGSDSMTVTVEDPGPVVQAPSISITGSSTLEVGENGTFNVNNNGGPIDTYSWSTNGGGGSGSGSSFNASWASAGNYTVTLTVSGEGGSDTATFSVTVEDPPPDPSPFGMTCNVSEAVVNANFRCQLTTGSEADFSDPQWSVSPATSGQWLMSPFMFDAAGDTVGQTLTITLTATDLATGLTVSDSHSVSIIAEPIPALGLSCSPTTRPADGFSASTCLITNASEFSNVSVNASPFVSNAWGSPGEWYFAHDTVGTVTVSASATHIASGTTVSAAPVTLTFEAVAPQPATMTVGCSVSTAAVGDRFNCSLTSGNAGSFNGLTWAVSPASHQRWGGGGSLDVSGTAPGTLTIQLTGTDIATGQVVSASATVTIT